ncbi:hypothetical protein TthAA37_22020 (plasmid) [Thermus thermophilus]|uniref:Uncharacterized protein n=1 Tax=Thermus thermophilus TaxID=274 RepID=A0AAD1NZU6_THETH|nr:hypothetical protein [Thermus thermophilus]BBL83355.1 hypothetical protein TthAA220_21390 [Thermus thermophilus]BBL85628.1 hypothetical protein TthAA229_21090 [Thermus thermophilus]BCZ88027.1 hypothetical protein TthAA11_22090 [Thermus thermophilus]BCZ90357.1 hypothetical protein TthAA22_21620 [Thermus thermophilus]BCZ93013.1 hypothetical protein TthAA37_22020 [Thermus thermophilus]
MAIARRLLGGLVAVGLALAAVSVLPALPKALEAMKSWPEGTQFALVDAEGQVVWQPGAKPTRDALAKAVALMIILPDGTSYLVEVKVEGEGLGEVQLTVDGKRVPLPELLHAKGIALEDGKLVWSRGQGKVSGGAEEGSEGASGARQARGEGHGQHGRGGGQGHSGSGKSGDHNPHDQDD